MTREDDIRNQVAEAYTRAVTAERGCCGGDRQGKGVVVSTAGYDEGALAALPADAVENSFGCGNPVAYSELKAGETVLDLGSGAGIDLLLAADKVGAEGRVIGVDMTDEMIARARANIAAAGRANVEVRKGFIEELPVEDASVDVVISNCVINLSPNKPRVFSEIARVLKPGGRMRVSDLVVKDLPAWVRESPALYSSCISGAVSEEEYLAGLRAAGLGEVEVRDRLVYDSGLLQGLLTSEVEQEGEAIVAEAAAALGCRCGGQTAGDVTSAETVAQAADALAGKVASVLVTARRQS